MSCDREEAYNCSSDLTSLCSPDKFSDVLEQKKCQGAGLNKSKLNVNSGGTIWSIHTNIHTTITLTYIYSNRLRFKPSNIRKDNVLLDLI